jgi:ribosomal protein L3
MPEDNLLVVKGAVPGPDGAYLVIKQSQKDPAYKP